MDAYIAQQLGLTNSENNNESNNRTHDAELWARLTQSQYGNMIKDFCEGKYETHKVNGEYINAIQAAGFVMPRLAYICNFDNSQIERLFKQTQLFNEVKDKLKTIISDATIFAKDKLDTLKQEFSKDSAKTQNQQANEQTEPNKNELERKKYSRHSFAEFCRNPAPIKYYIKNYIQEQALHMIFGAPGSGKSFVAVDMAARECSH